MKEVKAVMAAAGGNDNLYQKTLEPYYAEGWGLKGVCGPHNNVFILERETQPAGTQFEPKKETRSGSKKAK